MGDQTAVYTGGGTGGQYPYPTPWYVPPQPTYVTFTTPNPDIVGKFDEIIKLNKEILEELKRKKR